MPLGIFFWVLMLLWLVFGLWNYRDDLRGGNLVPMGGNFLLYLLLFVLGWKVFGFILQG